MGCGISQHGEGTFDEARYNMVGRQMHYNSSNGRYDGQYVRSRTSSSRNQGYGRDEENPEVTAEQTATRLLLHGNALVEKANFTEAIEAYSKALLYKEDLERVYLERGLAYYKVKEYAKATEDLTTAIRLGTYVQMAYFVRATIYKEQGELNSALDDLTNVVKAYPEHVEAYQLRSTIYQKLGDMEKSLADLEKAGLIEENRYCVICLENPRETRLHPCLHASLCTKCATGLCKQNMGCPLCGAAIEHVEFGKFDSTFAFDDACKMSCKVGKPKQDKLTVPEGAVQIY